MDYSILISWKPGKDISDMLLAFSDNMEERENIKKEVTKKERIKHIMKEGKIEMVCIFCKYQINN